MSRANVDLERQVLEHLVESWFREHAEMDRERYLTLVEEAKAVAKA